MNLFKIKSKPFNIDLPIITEDYSDIYFLDQPILFSGKNIYGNNIIGVLIQRDEDNQISRYLHLIIENKLFDKFKRRKIDLLTVLKDSNCHFIIDQNENLEQSIFLIDLNEIPDEFLPEKDAMYPEIGGESTYDYTIKLEGGLADNHQVLVDVATKIENAVADFLLNPLDLLKNIGSKPNVSLLPSESGSYKLKFRVNIGNDQQDIFSSHEKISTFLFNYVDYVVNDLSSEAKSIVTQKETEGFDTVLDELSKIYNSVKINNSENLKGKLVENLKTSSQKLLEISDNIGQDYKSISISNVKEDEEKYIGLVDVEKVPGIQETYELIEDFTSDVEQDQILKEYKVLIYNLNTETRVGNAFMFIEGEEKKIIWKPRIKISGNEPLEETIYTESLYKGSEINVRAKARKVNGKIAVLEIESD